MKRNTITRVRPRWTLTSSSSWRLTITFTAFKLVVDIPGTMDDHR